MPMNKKQLRELIVETLQEVDLYSESAVELLMGTAAVESNLGEYIKQVEGPALGIFQMEPDSHDDIWNHYIKYQSVKIRSKIYDSAHCLVHTAELLRYNLKYAIIMARLQYYRKPDPLPDANDIEGMAYFWKKHYNTHLGKGLQTDFIDKYIKYVKG